MDCYPYIKRCTCSGRGCCCWDTMIKTSGTWLSYPMESSTENYLPKLYSRGRGSSSSQHSNSSLWLLTDSWFLNWQIKTYTVWPTAFSGCPCLVCRAPWRSGSQEQVVLPVHLLLPAEHFPELPETRAGVGSVLADLGMPHLNCDRSLSTVL